MKVLKHPCVRFVLVFAWRRRIEGRKTEKETKGSWGDNLRLGTRRESSYICNWSSSLSLFTKGMERLIVLEENRDFFLQIAYRKFQCPVPPSYIKFISVMRIFWVPWKVHNKFIMKWKRWKFSYYLIYAYILRIFRIRVCGFSINVKVEFHSNIQKQNLYKKFYTQ